MLERGWFCLWLLIGTGAACDTRHNVLVNDRLGQDAGTPDVDGGLPGPDAAGAGADAPDLPSRDAGTVFLIRTQRVAGTISPLVYGIEYRATGGTPSDAERPRAIRQGNHWPATYNWEINAANGGIGECFENHERFVRSNRPGDTVLGILEAAAAFKATAIVTLPLGDYVAADKLGGSGAPDCTGDVSKSADFLNTRFRRSVFRKPTPLSITPDGNDASVYQDEFLTWLKGAVPGAPVVVALDFTPDSWWRFFAPIHPDKLGYDELVDRTVRASSMIRDVWPGVPIVAFGADDWWGLTTLQGSPEAASKGNALEYFLDKVKLAEDAAGRSLIDQVNVHWAPQGVPEGDPAVPATTEARVQAPRSLWDPTFVEKSWITDSIKQPVRLLPRLRETILAHHPGLKLALGAWRVGAGSDISGAVATADVLGILGREGVALGTLVFNDTGAFALAGFRAFTNYDGNGGRFGDSALEAYNNDPAAASIYASVDSAAPGRMVMVAINKRPAVLPVEMRLDGGVRARSAEVWRLTAGGPSLVRAASPVPVDSGAVLVDRLPALSVSVYVLVR